VKLEEETQAEAETETQDDAQQETQTVTQEETQAEETVAAEPQTYIVQSGDTLTGISRKFYGTNSKAKEIAELNQLENSDTILAGQKLLLP
jgi:nucleoid-associated protein YgaU